MTRIFIDGVEQISASTSSFDVFVTGGTYTNGTALFTNNTGGTFNVSGFTTGSTSIFTTNTPTIALDGDG